MSKPTWDKAAADASAAEFQTKLTPGMTSEELAKLWEQHYMTSGHRRLADALVAHWREKGIFGKRVAQTPAPPSALDQVG